MRVRPGPFPVHLAFDVSEKTVATNDQHTLENLEKQPPHNIEAEVCVLGSLILDNELIGEVLEVIQPGDFYRRGHQLIFETMVELYDESRSVDQVLLCEELEQRELLEEVGGPDKVIELAEAVPTTSACLEYAQVIHGKAILRRLVHVCNTLSERALQDSADPETLLDEAESEILNVAGDSQNQETLSVGELLKDTIDKIEESRENDGLVTGISTGLNDLDEQLGGLRKGAFIVLAGRPSMGKTSLARTLAGHAAINEDVPTAFFSLEMTSNQIAMTMLLGESGVPPYKVKKGMISEQDMKDITTAAGRFENAPLYVDDSNAVTSSQLRARMRRMKSNHDIELVIIDYLQLMQGPGSTNSRQEEIALISRAMKGIARELDLSVLALSQLNRNVEQRNPPRPKLADLRESGAIEQDADVVLLLYRDFYYTGNEDTKGITEVIVAKHRNGPTGTVKIFFDEELMEFQNLHQEPAPI